MTKAVPFDREGDVDILHVVDGDRPVPGLDNEVGGSR